MLAEQKFALSAGFGGPKSEPTKVESEGYSAVGGGTSGRVQCTE
jgi:hypothetical protein